jgi:hypothetical protein
MSTGFGSSLGATASQPPRLKRTLTRLIGVLRDSRPADVTDFRERIVLKKADSAAADVLEVRSDNEAGLDHSERATE